MLSLSVYFDHLLKFLIQIKSLVIFYFGIFASPFLSLTPHCNAFRWIIYEAGNVLYGMWMAIGSWTVANVLTHK
jgi:hypothetical protein